MDKNGASNSLEEGAFEKFDKIYSSRTKKYVSSLSLFDMYLT